MFMDTKYSHLVQIGEIGEETIFYFEDYAYTYLKKNEEKEKFNLYGEIKFEEEKKKIYIYGMSPCIKQEKDYFKEYTMVGILKIKEDKFYWSDTKKNEEEINGYYIFYATNQAMQEYLIDHNTEEKEMELLKKERTKRVKQEEVPIREVLLSKSPILMNKKNPPIFYPYLFIPVMVVVLVVLGLLPENATKKIEVFKEILQEVNVKNDKDPMDISIEEIAINENQVMEETEKEESITVSQEEIINKTETKNLQTQEIMENIEDTQKKVEETEEKEEAGQEVLQEYIVQEGDTLARICKKFYGDTGRIKEICEVNEIKNEDYIAPGQKLYLPN